MVKIRAKGKAAGQGKVYGSVIGNVLGKEGGKAVGKKVGGKSGAAVGGAVGGIVGKTAGSYGGQYGGYAVGKGYHYGRKDGVPIAKTVVKSFAETPIMRPAVMPHGSAVIGSFKKGGRVKKTGNYLLHKGEYVVPNQKKGKRRHILVIK